MIFFELIGAIIVGGFVAWLMYEIVLYGLLSINNEIDLLSPAVVSTLIFGAILAWRFDFSLTTFLMYSSEDVTGPSSAILSIVSKLKYVLLVIGFGFGLKLKLRSVAR